MSRKACPPAKYLDGCTLAPDRLGAIYHGDICIDHDRAYWHKRRAVDKIAADVRWAYRIIRRHSRNKWYWFAAAILLANIGFIALSTVGTIFWVSRHRWDK